MTNKKNICIIGAGIGGLTAGALLTKKGFNVTIYEKESLIGGRAIALNPPSISVDEYKKILSHYNMSIPFSEPDLETIFNNNLLKGYKFDLGYHVIGGGARSIVNSILSEFDDYVEMLESNVGLVREDGYSIQFLSKFDRLKILPNILRLLFAGEKTLKKLDKISMTETIKKYGKGKMKIILEIFSRSITTMNDLDKISTGEMIRAQRNLYKGSKAVGYPKGGLNSITQKFSNYIIQNGGKIILDKTVEKIIIKENKAVGIKVDNQEHYFDIIVSNILIQNLFKIAEEKHFSQDYINEIKSLKGTGSLCAYYSVKNVNPELIGRTFHFIQRNTGLTGNDIVGMIDFMITDSNCSPKGEYLIHSYVICTPEEAKNKDIQKKLRNYLDKYLNQLISDLQKNLNWAIYPAIWHLDGVAKTIDKDKPTIQTTVENLFVIGDCVKAPGIGYNCALNSALILTKILIEKP